MQLERPSFAFGTNGTHCPSVLALDPWPMRSVCPSFAFGTDGARGSVFFGPNQGMVRKPNITITRGKITS